MSPAWLKVYFKTWSAVEKVVLGFYVEKASCKYRVSVGTRGGNRKTCETFSMATEYRRYNRSVECNGMYTL